MRIACLVVFQCVFSFLTAQTADSTFIRQVDSLINVSRTLTGQRQLDQALEINAEAERIALEHLGRASASYGSCCINHGRVLYFQGKLAEAETWYETSRAIREEVLGKDHPDYAASLNGLAILNQVMGQYEKAEALYLESMDIKEKTLGKEHPEYAASLNNLANLYKVMGRFDQVASFYIESNAITAKTLGKDHPHYCGGLENLADLYYQKGQYELAKPLLQENLAIKERVLGKNHPNYATSLNLLANLYLQMGQYELAEPLYLECKAIHENPSDQHRLDYAISLNNLAILNVKMGRYEQAETWYLESRDILEKVLGKDHPNVASSLNGLAGLYLQMGQYDQAEAFYRASKDIREKALGREHRDYAESLGNLANVYQESGHFDQAEPLLLEARSIREKALGREHPEYASGLHNLANLYKAMGQYDKSEPLFLESNALKEKGLGTEHPGYATGVNNLALLYHDMGRNDQAEALLIKAKDIREKALGKEHPDYAGSVENLATFYQAIGQDEQAEPYFIELSGLNQSLLAKATLFLSEKELHAYLKKFSVSQDLILSFAERTGRQTSMPLAYDNSLFYKGFLLHAAAQVKRKALADPNAAELFHQWTGYQRRLGDLYTQPIADRDSDRLNELESQANRLEKELTRTVSGYGEARRQVTWQDVQARLQAGEAAVEFVHYHYYEKDPTDSILYAALLLLPGKTTPRLIPLFEERSLDSLIQTNGERRVDYINRMYAIAERGMVAEIQPKKTLYKLIWKPLEPELSGIKTVYFSPTGLLHRINLNAIAVDETSSLVDHYNLVEVNSTRQLVIPANLARSTDDAVLFGGVQYELDTVALLAIQMEFSDRDVASRGELSIRTDESLSRGGSWNELKWTVNEVEAINEVLQAGGFGTTMRKGYSASEEAFRHLGQTNDSPRVIHLATHGYFFPDPTETTKKGSDLEASAPVFKVSDHPMVRSGLILAGGNHAWQNKPVPAGMEDGILTAYEISQMNLSNTELVVLSACETGLGDIEGNEGVYGLQRAFKIAGVKYLIMSLWQVPDRQTMQFMTTFYRHWLEAEGPDKGGNKMTIPEAFRKTQLEMRDRFFDAYNWAGFVLVE